MGIVPVRPSVRLSVSVTRRKADGSSSLAEILLRSIVIYAAVYRSVDQDQGQGQGQ